MTLTGLAARNILRNKFRAVLTILGVAVAILTFMLLRTVVYAWTSGGEFAQTDRVVTRHKITFVMTLPKRYIEDVRRTEGVSAATYANWFGGKDPQHETEFFATLAIDSKTFFVVMNEMLVPPDQLQAFQEDRQGAVVGDVIAKKMGWKLGDKVTLQSGIFPGDNWQFTIRGIYTATAKSIDRSTFVFHWDFLNDALPEARKDQIGWVTSRVKDKGRAADISLVIDKGFESSDIQTLSQDERSFQTGFLASFSAVLKAFDLISVVILVIMMLILGNTIAMGVRERTNEYGVLRALGFMPGHIVGFILGEAMMLGLIGGLLGVAIAYPFINGMLGRWLEENMGAFFPYFGVTPKITATALAFSAGLGAIAAVLPALRASKLRVVDALRRVA